MGGQAGDSGRQPRCRAAHRHLRSQQHGTSSQNSETAVRKPTPLQTARWKAVQRAKRKGLSIRGIARELLHRDTVRKYMNAESPPNDLRTHLLSRNELGWSLTDIYPEQRQRKWQTSILALTSLAQRTGPRGSPYALQLLRVYRVYAHRRPVQTAVYAVQPFPRDATGQRQLLWPLCANYFGRSGSGVIVVCNCRSCACRPCASLVR